MTEHVLIAANAVRARMIDADLESRLLVSDVLSYYVDGAEHTGRGKNQGWDGRTSFLEFSTGIFPAGFISSVVDKLKEEGYSVTVRKKPLPAPLGPCLEEAYKSVNPFEIDDRYDYQPETVRRLTNYGAMIAQVATGGGKCHRKGTPIIMADSSIKNVEDVKVGDLLASPTGGFRTVKGLARGNELMYRITPVKGDTFYCNASHVLSLKKTGNRNTVLFDGQKVHPEETVEVSVDVLFHSSDHAKHCLKLWRPEGVEFQSEDIPLPMPAYILGAWLGDGTARMPGISTPPCKMADEWCEYARALDLEIREAKSKNESGSCPTLYATGGMQGGKENPITTVLRDIGVLEGHYKIGIIPSMYKRASIEDRLELLAGLMDSDGHARSENRGYDFVSKYKQLSEDVAFVARSVGLRATVKQCNKSSQNGYVGTYWRVAITGNHCAVPSRDKPTSPHAQKKNPLVTGFKIEPVGVEDYYGFEIDGDHLYMLGDFTVQHNSMIARAAVKRILRPTIFITTRQVLMYQMKKGFEEAGFKVGVMGDGEWKPTRGINVAMIQTIDARLQNPETLGRMTKMLHMFEFAILEEAHEAGSETYFRVMNEMVNAHYRLALTATPFMRGDTEANMRLMAVSGQIGIRIPEKMLIERQILARPLFQYRNLTPPADLKSFQGWQKAYDLGVVKNETRNADIVGRVKFARDYGLPVMILVQRKAHGVAIRDACREAGFNTEFIHGAHDNTQRQKALNRLKSGETHVLIGSTILDVGVDVPAVGMVILAGGGKAEVALRQRIGRGLREKKSGPNICLVVDYNDTGNKYLKKHALARRKIVEETPGFVENILKRDAEFDMKGLGFRK